MVATATAAGLPPLVHEQYPGAASGSLRRPSLPTDLPAPRTVALHVEPTAEQLHLDYEHSQLPPDERPVTGRDSPP